MKLKHSSLVRKVRNIIKINKIKMQPKVLLPALFPLVIFVIALAQNLQSEESSQVLKSPNLEVLADINELNNIPNAETKSFLIENSQKTALLILQNHKYPGSKATDKINDSAQTAQKQIYEVISTLHQEYGIDFIMAEGELFGPVDEEKVAILDQKIAKRDQFAEKVNRIVELMKKENDIDQQTASEFNDAATAYLDQLDREIILEGASYAYIAKENCGDIKIYGTENQQTQDESKKIVQEYLYEKDRLAQLNGTNKLSQTGILENSFSLGLSMGSQPPKIENAMDEIEVEASSCANKSLTQEIDQAQNDFYELEKLDARATQRTEDGNLPERSKNPFADINNPDELKTKMKQTEENIQQVVINKRNRETAQYFNAALEQNNENIGILQYGAGHEEGLVSELNKLGISVVVIKPNEVAKREKSETSNSSNDSSSLIESQRNELLGKLEALKKSTNSQKGISADILQQLKEKLAKQNAKDGL